MKDVLIAIEYFPPTYTGAGLRASRFIERISKNYKINFKVLCSNKKNKTSQDNSIIITDKIAKRITRLPTFSEDSLLFPIHIFLLFFQINYYMLKNRKNIEIIHFFSFSWFNRILMFSNMLFYKKKTILEVTLEGSDDPVSLLTKGRKNKMFRWFTLKLLKHIDKFMVPSDASLNSCKQCNIPSNKVWIRPHPVDETLFGAIKLSEKNKLRKKLKLPNKYLLLTVGMLYSRKNQLFIAKAIKSIKNKNITLIIIGPRSEEEPDYSIELNNYIKKNKLEKQVIILESQPNINEYMAAADLFVFASKSEGFPNVIAEAVTSGLPFITLYLDGLKNIDKSNIGIMLPKEENETNLFKKYCTEIVKMQKNKNKFNRENIRTLGIKLFSSKKIDEQYVKIYRSIIQ